MNPVITIYSKTGEKTNNLIILNSFDIEYCSDHFHLNFVLNDGLNFGFTSYVYCYN